MEERVFGWVKHHPVLEVSGWVEDGWVDRRINEWIGGLVGGWMKEWMVGWVIGWGRMDG